MRTSATKSIALAALFALGCSSPTSTGLFVDGGVVGGRDAPVGGDAGPAATPAYAACTAGASCGGGTVCNAAGYTSDGRTANFCTAACATGDNCPPSVGAALAPTCVFNAGTGTGQCYDACTVNADCGEGTTCAMISGTPNRICVPGSAAPATPPPPPYTGCTPAGATCAGGTTCTPSAFVRTGASQGNLCTIACTSGNAAMCPGYVPGAAVQAVECVAPTGNPAAAQCMRLCDPANSNRDCAPYFTACATVQMAAGQLSVCVP